MCECRQCGAGLAGAAAAGGCPRCGSQSVRWCFGCGVDQCCRCGMVIGAEPAPEPAPAWKLAVAGCLARAVVLIGCLVLCAVCLAARQPLLAALWASSYLAWGLALSPRK